MVDRRRDRPARPGEGAVTALRIDRYGLLLLPLLAFLAVVFVYPLVELLQRSFTDFPEGAGRWWENYRWFFDTPTNVKVLVRTLVTGLWVTAFCLVVGYPYAYLMTIVRPRWRFVMLAFVLLPFWTSYIVRNFAWIVLMQDDGFVNDVLGVFGLGPLHLLGTTKAVTIGMAQVLVPFMVIPAYATMRRIDRNLLRAATSLGARPSIAFWRVYFPLSLPGVLAGALLVFVISLSFYITPAMLGSPQDTLLAQLIYIHVSTLLEWGQAGAMAVVLLAATLLLLGLAARLSRRSLARLGDDTR